MFLPKLREGKKRIQKDNIVFAGLDQNARIDDNYLSACTNLSFKNLPLLSARPPRETLYTLASAKAMFAANSKLAWVDGTDFKYDNTTEGTVTASEKYMVDFNGKILIFPDKKSYDYGTDTFANIGTGTYPAAGSTPDIDYVTTYMNRVFGCKGSDVYATALGDYDDWTTFAGVSTDAYAADVETEGGNFTGIIAYRSSVIIFKQDRMYELLGNRPANFSISLVDKVGALNGKAMCEVNQVLYFAGPKGIYAFNGGTPKLISVPLNDVYSTAVMGTDGRLLYVSLYNGTSYKLYVYDTLVGGWLQEDTTRYLDFVRIGNYVYGLASTGPLQKFNSSTETIAWTLETKDFTEDVFNKKLLTRIFVHITLETGSSATLSTSKDGAAYASQVTWSTAGQASYRQPVDISAGSRIKIKLAGSGDFKLHQLTREFFVNED